MSLRVRATTNNVAITIFVIFASIVVAAVCNMVISHNAGALKLDAAIDLQLPELVAKPINRILGNDVKSRPPAHSAPDNGGTSAPGSSAASPDAGSADGNSSSGGFDQPTTSPVNVAPLTELPPLHIDLGDGQVNQSGIVVSNSAREVLGQSTINSPASIIRATNNGWEILGAPWYVWLVCAGAVAFALRYRQWVLQSAPVNEPSSR